MPNSDLFTAVVHTYNRPALLREAVDALFRQSHDNLEIILINNGGTPETVEYLHEVAAIDKRVKLVNFEENQYSPDDPLKMVDVCWNAALRAATGDYIWVQEDDDLIADDYAEKMVALFKGNPECTSAAGLTVGIDVDGAPTTTGPRVSNFRPRYMPGHLLALDRVRGGQTLFSAPGTIFTFRKDVLAAAGGFHRSIVLSQLYGIVPFGVTGFDETALCYWRYHPGALNRHLSAWGWIGIKEDRSMLTEWNIEGRWQVFGAGVAKEVVSRVEGQICNTAAEWFLINLAHRRLRACLRILLKIWRRPRFWVRILVLGRTMHPFGRWLRPVVRGGFRLWPGLVSVSPKFASLRDRVNR